MSKVVIVTGVTGQDGSLMVDYLLENTDYKIYGGVRRLSVSNHTNISHIDNPRFELFNFDLTDAHSIEGAITKYKPDYFVNVAAQSFVGSSWDFPVQTYATNTTGVLHILEAIRKHHPVCRFYNAGSSEEFGDVVGLSQNETHPLRPRSPYGASKASARLLVKVYRESYDLFAIQGWLFNHEGIRRGREFVTRKITQGVARIHHAINNGEAYDPILLGNLDSRRDWSDAEDMVRAIWQMLINEQPVEYVIGSGEAHSVREFVQEAFSAAGINGTWHGIETDETYTNPSGDLVNISKEFYRPAEVDFLKADISKAQLELNWKPECTFKELVTKMVQNDINLHA